MSEFAPDQVSGKNPDQQDQTNEEHNPHARDVDLEILLDRISDQGLHVPEKGIQYPEGQGQRE